LSPHASTFQPALRALDLILGWRDQWLPLEFRNAEGTRLYWHRCGQGSSLVDVVRRMDEKTDDEVHLRLPQPRTGGLGPMGATVLWASIAGGEQQKRAFAFRPRPTLVLREGNSSRRLLIWALREWLDYFEVEDLNKRIAYRLGAVQRNGLPEEFCAPAPGTFLRLDRSRAVPVVVSRLESDAFPSLMARRLKAPPPPKDWRNVA
jgi:hypothetical protein